MAFVDELHLYLKAGHGGKGVVHWLHLKGKEFSGPAGGNGGRGGDVIARAVRDITVLQNYTHQKKYVAGNGGAGQSRSKEGKNGDDFILEVPIGTVLTNRGTDERFELLEEGAEEVLLKGGSGGYGNEHFKGSQNVAPQQSTPGKPGEEEHFDIELQLVVDAGLVGVPNAGKSSLLNELTGAKAKVGAYEFTTLNPNLGVLYGFVLADIPGLIEGAAEGKGLGDKFLRHVKRTKIILHCISLEHDDVVDVYKTIRDELAAYSDELAQKPEYVILTKTDVTTPEKIKEAIQKIQKETGTSDTEIFTVSVYDDASLKALSDGLIKILKQEAGVGKKV